MGYIKVYQKWLPYINNTDTRGFISKQFSSGRHSGVDSVGNIYNNLVSTPISGVVKVNKSLTMGNQVEIDNGKYKIVFSHLKEVLVSSGRNVSRETAVAIEGNTGSLSNGKHLHTSLYLNGKLIDPEPYLCGEKFFEGGGECVGMKYKVGDIVEVCGLIANSAYASKGILDRPGNYEITKIYDGTNFPYQLGVVGFINDEGIRDDKSDDRALQLVSEIFDRLDELRKIVNA